jgi:hypothetical protein
MSSFGESSGHDGSGRSSSDDDEVELVIVAHAARQHVRKQVVEGVAEVQLEPSTEYKKNKTSS